MLVFSFLTLNRFRNQSTLAYCFEMISYSKVCEILTDAVSMTTDFCPPFTVIPSDDIPTEGISDSYGIKYKVQKNYDKWANHSRHSIFSELVCRGYCEIDNFTGNDLLRILCNIISKKIDDGSYAYKPGDVLYFSKNRNAYAGIMFTKSKPVTKTSARSLFKNEEYIKYKYLYNKLFDDRLVKYYRKKPHKYQEYYSQKYVEEFRRVAEDWFSHFLNTKMKDYGDLPVFLFGDQFFGMLVTIAYRIGSRGNPRYMREPLNIDIPFAACIKFAFDNSQTGKVTALCGEIGMKPANFMWKERAKSIKDTAEELIKW